MEPCHGIFFANTLSMIRMRLELFPPQDRVDEVVSALRLMISRTKVKPGCEDCRLARDERERTIVTYEEMWQDWDHLKQHIRSESYRTLLELMEISTEPPVLQFEEPGIVRGIEFVQQVMKG